MAPRVLVCLVAGVVAGAVATNGYAQGLPSEPVSVGDGRVVISGDVTASFGSEDPGYFNYSDYEYSTLRELRLGVSTLVRATDRVSVLAQIRADNLEHIRPFALYARIRPFPGRAFDVQIGRIPPTFGTFARQAYSRDNLLIGSPLAYQYLTSLRADALPANPDELVRMRSRGWLTSYTVGDQSEDRGVPLVSATTWDTGVQFSGRWRAVEMTGAITNGTASRPRVSDDNGGKQIATRVTFTPTPGITVGSSYARGAFTTRRVLNQLSQPDGSYAQEAHGLDLSISRGHWLMRADAMTSAWRVPFADLGTAQTLRAASIAVEGRYTFLPGMYAAARAEHLAFSRIATASRLIAWDAPVSRVEVGGGYYLRRNVIARASLQFNERETGRVTHARLVAAQLLYWF